MKKITGVHRWVHRLPAALALGVVLPFAPLEAQVDPDPAGSASADTLNVTAEVRAIDQLHFGLDADSALARARTAVGTYGGQPAILLRAARQAVHAGMLKEAADRKDEAKRLFTEGEAYARRSLEADSTLAEGWSWVAIATGRRSALEGVMTRVELAGVLKESADRALQLDSLQSGALHVLGAWHAEVRRLNRIERFTAGRLPGGGVFGDADWGEAERLLRLAAEVAPDEVVHRLELGRILLDTDRRDEGLETLRRALELEVLHPTDPIHFEAAREILLREGG